MQANEKAGASPLLPLPYTASPNRNSLKRNIALSLAFIACGTYVWLAPEWIVHNIVRKHHPTDTQCAQSAVLTPAKNGALWDSVSVAFGTEGFKAKAVEWIGGAVRVPTESYDDMGAVGEDPRWDAFAPFHDYLLGAFPLVHSTLKLTKVNTYGLIFTWQGSDASLKPLVLMGHQDVVPVNPETVLEWTYPPYSGHFDGERVWGRGSSDDKSGLIGALTLQCVAEHAKDLDEEYRKTIKRAAKSKKYLRKLEKAIVKNNVYASLVGTTQAIDIIEGGVKANALPERAFAVVNHRISVISSVGEVQAHDTELLRGIAEKLNLTYSAFGKTLSEDGASSAGTLTLTDAYGTALEPAPVTPTSADAVPWNLLSGTIKATYNSHRSLTGTDEIIVSPGMPSGNTDTRYYWGLTKHIFRYNHSNAGNKANRLGGVHTINENIEIDAFVEIIRFFATLILNTDEATNL
ncbi:hypothetical protein C0991_002060 [Blastosporella zonata]|nr:hypothetical protein C0991_002060 [Blastosporella zonata]